MLMLNLSKENVDIEKFTGAIHILVKFRLTFPIALYLFYILSLYIVLIFDTIEL